jgi:hypothetical protein
MTDFGALCGLFLSLFIPGQPYGGIAATGRANREGATSTSNVNQGFAVGRHRKVFLKPIPSIEHKRIAMEKRPTIAKNSN